MVTYNDLFLLGTLIVAIIALVMQGGVSIEDQKITDPQYRVTAEALKNGIVLKKGKKVFHKFRLTGVEPVTPDI